MTESVPHSFRALGKLAALRLFSSPGADGQDEAIIRSVIALARPLRLSVTAAGIETADQLALLRVLGCDQGQGFLMGRPVPPSQWIPMA